MVDKTIYLQDTVSEVLAIAHNALFQQIHNVSPSPELYVHFTSASTNLPEDGAGLC
jgi:hypothetical protein